MSCTWDAMRTTKVADPLQIGDKMRDEEDDTHSVLGDVLLP